MTEKYHINSRILHWLMSLIIIGLLGLGIYMTNFLENTSEYRSDFYHIHKSFGVIILALIFIRILNRIINKAPALPISIARYERILAHFGHFSLYLLMLAMPLSGYLMSNSYGYQVKLFSITLPNLIEKNYDLGAIFSATHKYAGYFMIALVALHIIGALKHKFFDKNKNNDVLKRMI